jgi:pimeloyl-ACP methyl ester carboxylesterase
MMSLEDWKTSGEFVHLSGHQIFVRRGGKIGAPVLLLIHGFPSASWDWEGVWDTLGQHYELLTLDMLGFGFSDKPSDAAYLIREQAELFLTYLAKHKVSSYHILAHDYGDTVAQELLARMIDEQGERRRAGPKDPPIKSVCFLNGGLFPETHKPVLIQKLLLSPLGPLVAKLTTKKKFAANFNRIFGPDTPPSIELIDGLWALLELNSGVSVMPKLIDYMLQRRDNRARWVGALTDSPVALKLICGALDPISGSHMSARYRELVPNANVTDLATLGHYPQVESPSEVAQAYLEFRRGLVEGQDCGAA